MAATRDARRSAASPPRGGARALISGGMTAHSAWTGAVALTLFAVLHLALLLLVFPNTREDVVLRGNLSIFFHDSGRALSGAIPYRDFLLEYPPGSLLVMMVPRVFAVGLLRFRALFFAEIAALDLVILWALYALARGAGRPAVRVLALYTLALAAVGPLVIYRLDLAPAALTMLALLAWQRQRPTLAALALAAGTAIKLYPLVLLPALLLEEWLSGGTRRAARALLVFVLGLAVLFSPAALAVLLAGTQGLAHAIEFQTGRHLQVESIWAMPPLLLHLTTGFALQVAARGRALVILGPGDAVGDTGTPALILVALLIYWRWWRMQRREARQSVRLVGAAALILAAAILSKVLSPQYLLWVMPVLALLPWRARPLLLAVLAFGAALPLTQWIYPMHYGELVRLLSPLAIGVLLLRNLLLLLALAALLIGFWRMGDGKVGSRQ